MDSPAEVGELVDLGLTRYEAKGYLSLLGRGSATPAEVARLARMPRQRVYDVLASLAERGLVTPLPGDKLHYRAQPPDQVMSRLITLRRQELERVEDRAAQLADRLMPRFTGGQQRDEPLSYVEVLRDRQHAVARVGELWEAAERELLTFVRPPYLAPPATEDARLPRALSQRALYETSLLEQPELAELVRTYATLGEQVRVIDRLPLKLTIVDGQAVAFNMPDPIEGDDSVTTLVVHHPMLAETLTVTFETLWQHATPLEEALAARTV